MKFVCLGAIDTYYAICVSVKKLTTEKPRVDMGLVYLCTIKKTIVILVILESRLIVLNYNNAEIFRRYFIFLTVYI